MTELPRRDPRTALLVSDKQKIAIEAILAGETLTDAAKAAGVSRVTVWRWKTENTAFGEELQRRRQELRDARQERVGALFDVAMDVLKEHLAEGDAQIAQTIFRQGVRLVAPPVEGPKVVSTGELRELEPGKARAPQLASPTVGANRLPEPQDLPLPLAAEDVGQLAADSLIPEEGADRPR